MSFLGTLRLMVTSLVARPKTADVVATEFQAKLDELTRQRDEALVEADRWRALCGSWRQRYELLNAPQVPAINEYQQGAQMAQRCAQMRGAQNLAEWCNCAPARHDLLTRP